ncbi:MAG: hypothetical protein IPI03_18220 [Rubrivivax sp.]|nr:hypothetical protein [Rubrivivax sp.]
MKPRAALFTTFTFSVSHFDAVFLPVLRSVGCQDISVLVDADQAAAGVEEFHSRAAGRVYRVAPVIPPGGGYFHPKLAYLAAETDDVLAVASGNLTASGQSLQLESFDSVSARSVPTIFGELADWMRQLATLVEGTSPQAAQLLAQTAPRARQAYRLNAAAAAAGPFPPPTLVHTLAGTARDALEAVFIAEADAAEAVTVLSPFHAPDGGPVLRLASAVEARLLAVGLDGGRKQLTAPFEQGRFKPQLPGRFVIADTARNNKRLHAKVFEIQAVDKGSARDGLGERNRPELRSLRRTSRSPWRDGCPKKFAWNEVSRLRLRPRRTQRTLGVAVASTSTAGWQLTGYSAGGWLPVKAYPRRRALKS